MFLTSKTAESQSFIRKFKQYRHIFQIPNTKIARITILCSGRVIILRFRSLTISQPIFGLSPPLLVIMTNMFSLPLTANRDYAKVLSDMAMRAPAPGRVTIGSRQPTEFTHAASQIQRPVSQRYVSARMIL